MTTILYVEDEPDVQQGYARALGRLCDELLLANNGEEGLSVYLENKPDIIVSDINMPKKNGIEMAKEIHQVNPEQIIIFTTAHSESVYLLDAIDIQVDSYLLKPVDKNKLKQKINKIIKRLALEKEVLFNQNITQQILNKQSSISFVTDLESISFSSQSFLELFHIKTVSEFFKRYASILDVFIDDKNYLHADSKASFLSKYYDASALHRLVKIKPKNNLDLPSVFQIQIDRIDQTDIGDKGKGELCLISLTDITHLDEYKVLTEHKANYDPLTNIYNRGKFEEIFHYEQAQSLRHQADLTIAIIDIDHFKGFNDNYGHQAGDEALVALSHAISTHIRASDTFARWGGEEFTLIMPKTDKISAYNVCEKLRVIVSKIPIRDDIHITISIGISSLEEDDGLHELFERCDAALYKAKDGGRNRVEVN